MYKLFKLATRLIYTLLTLVRSLWPLYLFKSTVAVNLYGRVLCRAFVLVRWNVNEKTDVSSAIDQVINLNTKLDVVDQMVVAVTPFFTAYSTILNLLATVIVFVVVAVVVVVILLAKCDSVVYTNAHRLMLAISDDKRSN